MASASSVQTAQGIEKKALDKKSLGVSAASKKQINKKHLHATTDQISRKKKKKLTKEKKNEDLNTEKTESTHVTRLPQKAADYSANWKKLLQVLPQAQKPKSGNSADLKLRKTENKEGLQKFKSNTRTDSDKKEAPLEIWFDGVDESLLKSTLDPSSLGVKKTQNTDWLVKPNSFKGVTKTVAMDCEMVGVGSGVHSILARISIVNNFGNCIYDKYVKPTERVSDYRTAVSGIRPEDIERGEDFTVVQKEVDAILNGRILVGHSLKNDFKVLYLRYPRHCIRDTSRYMPFRKLFGGKTPSLKTLSSKLLGVQIQEGEHSSVQDAQAAMRLYTMHKKNWESMLRSNRRWQHRKSSKRKQSNRASSIINIQPNDNFVTE